MTADGHDRVFEAPTPTGLIFRSALVVADGDREIGAADQRGMSRCTHL
jgi:hypothetical protein